LTTWSLTVIGALIIVSVLYGIWFNYLDSASYCYDDSSYKKNCTPIGEILGKNNNYQIWNILGHTIPSLIFFLYFKKIELLIIGLLVSSSIMDSPLWGLARLLFYNDTGLWNCLDGKCEFTDGCAVKYSTTYNLLEWIVFYYNPIGTYPVWDEDGDPGWPAKCLPTSSIIFWSLIIRISIAVLLINWQNTIEKRGEVFSLKNNFIKSVKKLGM
jgi:hypothetical protein